MSCPDKHKTIAMIYSQHICVVKASSVVWKSQWRQGSGKVWGRSPHENFEDRPSTASQLRLNREPPFLYSKRIFDGLGGFSCGRVPGRGPAVSVLDCC